MAKLTGAFKFIGSLEDFNAYKDPNSDDIILRRKGGPTEKQIKNNPQFENTRRLNREFGGCSTASKFIRHGLKLHKPLMHTKLPSLLAGHIKPLLKEDTQNEWGKRSFLFGKNTHLLQDYNLNPECPFESIVQEPITHALFRHTLSASILIPALQPGKSLIISDRHNHYSFRAGLAILPDLFFKGDKYYSSHYEYDCMVPAIIQSQWFPVNKGSSETRLDITFPKTPVNDSFSLMLSLSVCFATADQNGQMVHDIEAGCAKIMSLA